MTVSALQVLKIFGEMGRDVLDLHTLFEAAGNDPEGRKLVLDAVEELKSQGFLTAQGGDFYTVTEKGKHEIAALVEASSSAS